MQGIPCWTSPLGFLNPLQMTNCKTIGNEVLFHPKLLWQGLAEVHQARRCSEATAVAMVTAVRVTQAGLEGNCERTLGWFSHSGLLWRRPWMMALIFLSQLSQCVIEKWF